MQDNAAIAALSALALETRLRAFDLVASAGDIGLPVGEIATRLKILQSTASVHLATLARARPSRSVGARRLMHDTFAVSGFAALGQVNRYAIVGAIARAGSSGVKAGELATSLRMSASTLSGHLAILARAGLITSERNATSIIYRAETSTIRELCQILAHIDNCADVESASCKTPRLGSP